MWRICMQLCKTNGGQGLFADVCGSLVHFQFKDLHVKKHVTYLSNVSLKSHMLFAYINRCVLNEYDRQDPFFSRHFCTVLFFSITRLSFPVRKWKYLPNTASLLNHLTDVISSPSDPASPTKSWRCRWFRAPNVVRCSNRSVGNTSTSNKNCRTVHFAE